MSFKDETKLKAWLVGVEDRVRMSFAARCALRAMVALGKNLSDVNNALVLRIFQANFCVAVASTSSVSRSPVLVAKCRGAMHSLNFSQLAFQPYCAVYSASHSLRTVIGDDAATSAFEAASWANSACNEHDLGQAEMADLSIEHPLRPSSKSASDKTGVGPASPQLALEIDETVQAELEIPTAESEGSEFDHDPEYSEAAAMQDISGRPTWAQLWRSVHVPDVEQKWQNRLLGFLRNDPNCWAFWLEWYEAILEGQPLPWDLSFAIATQMTEADWEKDPRRVHDRILEIRAAWELARRPDSVPDLEAEALSRHVRTLLKDPEMTALTAEGAAELLERAAAEYCNASHQNRLPEALSHLEGLPPIFRRIAHLVKAEGKAKTAEAKLRAEIEALNAKVAELEADLKAARAKSVHGLFTQAMITAMGKTFGAAVVGGTGLAVCHFFGVSVSDLTLENLRGFLEEVEKATPAPPDASAVPPVIDV